MTGTQMLWHRAKLDFPARFLFKPVNLLTSHDLEPPTGADILSPEVNIRQRVAPSGAFWLCPHSGVLFLPAKDPTFRTFRNV